MSGVARRVTRPLVAATLLAATAPGAAAAASVPAGGRPPSVASPAKTSAAPPALDLSPATIREAIAASKRPEDDLRPVGGATFGGSAAMTQAARTDRAFRDAEIPTCMTPDAWRFESPAIGPISVSGLLALPFLAHAIATGKCRH